MHKSLSKLEEILGQGRVKQNEQLATHTILQKNTIAEYYIEVATIDELVKAVKAARKLAMSVVVFGSGSFLSLPDETILGLTIKNNCRRFDKMSMRGKIEDQAIGVSEVLVQAESGTLVSQLVRFTIEEGLAGLEYQLGLPGTIGGAIYTNAAYKKNKVRDCLQAIRVLTQDGEIAMYLDQFANHLEEGILLSAIFRMTPKDKKILWERGEEALEYRNTYGRKR